MARNILITGSTGFLGMACQDYFQTQNCTLSGLSTRDCDIRDTQQVSSFITEKRPAVILHLAGQNSQESSFADPRGTFDVNVNGTISLIQAIKETRPLFLFMSTGAIYQESREPIDEDGAHDPKSPYAVSKYSAELMVKLLCTAYQIPFIIARGFKMIGPRQRAVAIDSKSARQLAQSEQRGEQCALVVKNPNAVMDCLDSRDAARALYGLIEKGRPGETYNLCSGKGYRLGDRIRHLISLSKTPCTLVLEHEDFFPTAFIGNHSKISADTGWQPHYDVMRDTLPLLLDYWRSELITNG